MEAILQQYTTSPKGLTQNEVEQRLKQYGPNQLPEEELTPIWKVFLSQFASPLIYVLLLSAVISVFVNELDDFCFVMGILVFNAIIGTIQEYSASKSAAALKHAVEAKATVLRDNVEQEIEASQLVPGDIVLLSTGCKVPADLYLITSDNLAADESMLTGESLAVSKTAAAELQDSGSLIQERCHEVFAATIIVKGSGTGVVTTTGLKTEIGKIADRITQKSEAKAPLLIRMEQFSLRLSSIIGIFVVLIGVMSLFNGTSLRDTLLLAAALAVAAIPEGLPIAVTVSLAVGMNRMAKQNVIVKNLVAVEALGSCTTIASDKTGTLTVNELTITTVVDLYNQPIAFPHSITAENQQTDSVKFLFSAAMANEASVHAGKYLGDPVDAAFLKFAIEHGIQDIPTLKTQYPQSELLRYSSESKFSASINQINGESIAYLKGAPETILATCQLNEQEMSAATQTLEELSRAGLRVIAVASGAVDAHMEKHELSDFHQMYFLGFAGMIDPLRPEAKEAVRLCQSAGVKVVMITGDNPITAHTIANELGFHIEDGGVITGAQIKAAQQIDDHYQTLDALTTKASVYARIEPTQKLDIIQSMIRNQQFVAVTGDGVNDAPAIKNANVGIAMGKSGTDIAKESASIVLTDDNFASIVKGIEEGRITYANIRKIICLLLSNAFNEIGVFILSFACGLPLPFSAMQLLWINVVTESFNSMPLAFDRAEGDEMQHPPRNPAESIFNRVMVQRIVSSALIGNLATFAIYLATVRYLHYDIAHARTLIVTLVVLFASFQVLNNCSEHRSLIHIKLKQNKLMPIGVISALVVHALALQSSLITKVLGLQTLSGKEWLGLTLIASSVLLVVEIEKWYLNRKAKNSQKA